MTRYTVFRQYDGCDPEPMLDTDDLKAAEAWIRKNGGHPADAFDMPEELTAGVVGGVGYTLVASIEEDGFVFPIAWIEENGQ